MAITKQAEDGGRRFLGGILPAKQAKHAKQREQVKPGPLLLRSPEVEDNEIAAKRHKKRKTYCFYPPFASFLSQTPALKVVVASTAEESGGGRQ